MSGIKRFQNDHIRLYESGKKQKAFTLFDNIFLSVGIFPLLNMPNIELLFLLPMKYRSNRLRIQTFLT